MFGSVLLRRGTSNSDGTALRNEVVERRLNAESRVGLRVKHPTYRVGAACGSVYGP